VAEADLGRGLLAYLRARLAAPSLEFAEPPTSVTGGFDTRIFAFRLRRAPPAYEGPLILRLLGPRDNPARALREAVTQNTVADLGYPAPRSLLATADTAPLGGAFLIMERRPGHALSESPLFSIRRILLEAQLELHALDADVLLRALAREDLASRAAGGPALEPDLMAVGWHLAQLERRVTRGSLDGLAAAMAWLLEHRPPEPARRAICHGDFHPRNILVSGTDVTAVIDWPNAMIADPAYDVASTMTILGSTPVELLAVPAPLRWLIRCVRPIMVRRYLQGYRRRRALAPGSLAYYEALSGMRALIRTAENRAQKGRAELNPLDASSFGETVAARFARLTGVSPLLPRVKA
jgi:aminoglycoside phosphotransferase (APT) family kinase protein